MNFTTIACRAAGEAAVEHLTEERDTLVERLAKAQVISQPE